MAFNSVIFGPAGQLPDYAVGEYQFMHALPGAGETQQLFDGSGVFAHITQGKASAAGGLLIFHDAATGDVIDGTNQIFLIDSTIVRDYSPMIRVTRGLYARQVTAGGGYITVSLRGKPTLSARTFR